MIPSQGRHSGLTGPLDYRDWFHADASVAILAIDADELTIVDANSAADSLYGYSHGEMIGRSLLEIVTAPELTRAMLKRAGEGLLDLPSRRVHRKKDGTPFPVTVALGVWASSDRRIICKYVQDATFIERTEQELMASNQKFRAVADYTYDWESWLDDRGALVWVNPAVKRFTGYSAQECLQMPTYPLNLIAPEDHDRVAGIIRESLDGSAGNDHEFRILDREGRMKWFAVSWQPLRDLAEKQIGVRMSMRDIDQRKAMEQQVKLYATEMERLAEGRARRIVKLEQEKSRIERLASLGELAASVAHEISNPLAGIKNALRLIFDGTPPESDQTELLRLIDQEIDRMTRVLRQMYQLYRPRTDLPRPIDIETVVRDMLLLIESERAAKGLSIRFENRSGTFRPSVPETEFRQIIHNLILNAVEATEPGGSIELISEYAENQGFAFTVKDDGIGIPAAILPQIFEPFFTTKAVPGRAGSGLGLPISLSLAQAMNGTISVEPTPGGGTTFVLSLPCRSEPDTHAFEPIPTDGAT